ncbi:hypothetical protein UC8_21700 [Roseimaritima ulvae]|uniref:Uncharacterized protein n=1 Tax=Roseimaritima ulvae TaxID=980254 RepID=A0A5B9QMK4_9BACT|nr:hypothetical protein UC8_21700 [Roseimaritima ulvae]
MSVSRCQVCGSIAPPIGSQCVNTRTHQCGYSPFMAVHSCVMQQGTAGSHIDHTCAGPQVDHFLNEILRSASDDDEHVDVIKFCAVSDKKLYDGL